MGRHVRLVLAIAACPGCTLLYESPIGAGSDAAVDSAAPGGDSAVPDGGGECWTRALTLEFSQAGSETQADIPMLVRFSADEVSALELGEDVAALRFTDASGSLLAFEVDHRDASGGLAVWVRTTIEPNPAQTRVVARGGNARAEPAGGAREVWSNNYLAVYHLDETLSEILDSGAGGHHGVAVPALEREVSGAIGPGLQFTGTSTPIVVPDDDGLDLAEDLTLEGWVYPIAQEAGQQQYVIRKDSAYNLGSFRDFIPGPQVLVWAGGSPTGESGSLLATNQWAWVVGTYDGASVRLYRDAMTLDGEGDPANGPIPAQESALIIGRNLEGSLDEVRVSSVARSPDWIALQYANMDGDTPTRQGTVADGEWCP